MAAMDSERCGTACAKSKFPSPKIHAPPPPDHGATAPVDQGVLVIKITLSQSDTSHSVGLLWMSDQPVAETST
jgi:hypothetical protein